MTGMWIVIGGLIVVAVGLVIVLAGMCRKVDVLRKKQKQYHDIVNQSLETFAHAIDAKDQNTNGHSQRVAIYSGEIAKRMECQMRSRSRFIIWECFTISGK